ncbi:MAG: hypothetical protein P4M14_00150 [Gammaproteobacteria bacterium]|nr:hypothetical protein [Gammaproteobacteria bacterium]
MDQTSNKRFLTNETGEIYQLVRLTYPITHLKKLMQALGQLACIREEIKGRLWAWYWDHECADMRFQSNDGFEKTTMHPIRLATLSIKENQLYIHLSSFKRACMAVPFFHQILNQTISHADFINKIFAPEETLPIHLNKIFKNEELNQSACKRTDLYAQIEKQYEGNLTTQEALDIMNDVVRNENKWEMPYVERYIFQWLPEENPQVIFMAFYLFMRSRELVAMKSAAGQPLYRLSDVVNETLEQAFGAKLQDKNLAPLFFRAQALFQGHVKQGTINIFC